MLDPTAVVTNGTLLFFAGNVVALLRAHHTDIAELKGNQRATEIDVAQLKERVKA
jgi:hypothetical protein